MTHEEIINSMKDGTLGEYISLAVANDWPKVKICETLNSKLPVSWSEVADSYNKYIEQYGEGCEEEIITRGRKVVYNGIRYNSCKEAAKANGLCKDTFEQRMKHGVPVLVYQERRYGSKPELLKKEKITKWKYDRLNKSGEIKLEREMPGFYV